MSVKNIMHITLLFWQQTTPWVFKTLYCPLWKYLLANFACFTIAKPPKVPPNCPFLKRKLSFRGQRFIYDLKFSFLCTQTKNKYYKHNRTRNCREETTKYAEATAQISNFQLFHWGHKSNLNIYLSTLTVQQKHLNLCSFNLPSESP